MKSRLIIRPYQSEQELYGRDRLYESLGYTQPAGGFLTVFQYFSGLPRVSTVPPLVFPSPRVYDGSTGPRWEKTGRILLKEIYRMRRKTRLLAVLLALILTLSLLPGAALADDPANPDGTQVDNPQTPGEDGDKDDNGDKDDSEDNIKDPEPDPKPDPNPDPEPKPDPEPEPKPDPEPPTKPEKPEKPAGCTGTEDCKAESHNKDCISQCTKDGSCTNTEGEADAHKTGCPKAVKQETPAAPTTITMKTPSASVKQNGRNLTVSYGISSDPSVSSFLSSTYFQAVHITLTVGSGSSLKKSMTGSAIGSDCTFENAVPTAQSAGSDSLTAVVEVIFECVSGTVDVGGKSYIVQGNDNRVVTNSKCTPSAGPENAVENPGKPLDLRYNPSTGALSWSITPTYKDNVKPGSTTKIDQFSNEHFILTLKQGSKVIEEDVHFDTAISSSTSSTIKTTRKQNSFSATYKPGKTLTAGVTYTISLLNERSMGSGGNLTGTCTFTVSDTAKPTTVKGALQKLIKDGFTSSSTAKDIRTAILDTVSGTTAATKLKNLTTSLQDSSSTGLDLVDLVQETEQDFLKAAGIAVKRKNAPKLETSISSVIGLGLNTARSNQISIESAEAAKSHDTPSGALACVFFSLNVSGLSDNKNMDFPVQVSMKLPDSFNSKDKVHVLHYDSSGKSEKLDAYILSSRIVFTTTSFSDFALVQENANGYKVTIASAENGTVTADKKEAGKDATVTLTLQPASGYSLAAMVITSKDGKTVSAAKKSDTQYTFQMPASDVSVQAVFMKSDVPGFTDVPADHTFYKEISWAAKKGIMNGTGNGQFSPGRTVSRQQLWMVLARTSGSSPANMAEARTWAINSGISDGSNPTGPVSRQQLVTMLYRYAVKQNTALSGSKDISTYADADAVSGYAKDAIAWAVGNGIVSGTSGNRLNPQGSATRAHFAAFLYRFGQKTGM